jgi:hypothetical protein
MTMVLSWSAVFVAGCYRDIDLSGDTVPECGPSYALKVMYLDYSSETKNERYDNAYSTFEKASDLLASQELEAAGNLYLEAARLFEPVEGISAPNREVVTYNQEYSYRSARDCFMCTGNQEAVARIDEILPF